MAVQLFLSVLLLSSPGVAQTVPSYTISTLAGDNTAGAGFFGDGGPAISAQFNNPAGVAVDKSGNVYIADQGNNVIREVTLDGNINTVAGNVNGTRGYIGDAGLASNASLWSPVGVLLDSGGNIYISDFGNDVIRKFTLGGNISTVAGNNNTYVNGTGNGPTGGFTGDGYLATSALLNLPGGLALDGAGNLYIADTLNNRIRQVVASTGYIKTVVGSGTQGSAGTNTDVGAALSVHLYHPEGLAMGPNGVLYIVDSAAHRVLKLSGGAVTVVAGAGTPGYSGDNGPAVNAQLQYPRSVAVDSLGNLYIADTSNQAIRFVSAATGNISTIAGSGCSTMGCRFGYSGDGGPGPSAQVYFPGGVAVDSNFNVYVADTQNNVIRKLTPSAQPAGAGKAPAIRTSAGVIGASGFGGLDSTAQGSWIEIYGSNLAPASDSRSWTKADFTGITAPNSLDFTTVSIGNQPAFVAYISPTQVNALVPSNVGLGAQPVVVSTAAGASNSFSINVGLTQPTLLALPKWNVGGKQYVTATFGDLVTFVGPAGAFPGVTSRPAKPGETIVLFGIGFGAVTGNIPAGQIVQQANALLNPVQFLFNGTAAATPGYYGLPPSPDMMGVYQFNVTVPTNVTGGTAIPLTFTLGTPAVAGTQTLYTAVQN